MASIRAALACILAFVLSAPAAAAPLEAYGRLPAIEDIDISPDGTRLAKIVTRGEERFVTIIDLADGKQLGGVRAGPAKVRRIQWADNDRVLITITATATIMDVSGPRAEHALVLSYDLKDHKQIRLLEKVEDSLNVVYGDPEVRTVDGKPVVVLTGVHFLDHKGRLALFHVDLSTGKGKVVETGVEQTRDYVVDAQGDALALLEYNPVSNQWALRVKQKGRWRALALAGAPKSRPTLLGLGRDGTSILLALGGEDDEDETGEKDDVSRLREVSPVDGTMGPPIGTGAQSVVYDAGTHRPTALFSLVGDISRYEFFDPTDQKIWDVVLKAYPGQSVTPVAASADHRKFILLVDSPTDGPAYALVDMTTGKATWLGRRYPGVKPADIATVRPIRFKAADGLEMTGYLTLPRDREAKGLPLVVFPHGGPAARDTLGFNWWAQAMASRGYAVLQVNYRGSSGLGRTFMTAGFGQWGRKMQTDLSDGVRHFAKEGIIDPKRVCIVGASYGGYAALAGATLDRGVYRCAASVAGPSDLRRMVIFSRGQSGVSAQRYWTRFMGAKNLNDPVLAELSPVEYAEKVDIPVLLVHGRDDTVVPADQSQRMADALKRAGKPVELVLMKGEDHWLTRGETRMQMLQSVVSFLEKNNPPT